MTLPQGGERLDQKIQNYARRDAAKEEQRLLLGPQAECCESIDAGGGRVRKRLVVSKGRPSPFLADAPKFTIQFIPHLLRVTKSPCNSEYARSAQRIQL